MGARQYAKAWIRRVDDGSAYGFVTLLDALLLHSRLYVQARWGKPRICIVRIGRYQLHAVVPFRGIF
jgi:hypothetical protein